MATVQYSTLRIKTHTTVFIIYLSEISLKIHTCTCAMNKLPCFILCRKFLITSLCEAFNMTFTFRPSNTIISTNSSYMDFSTHWILLEIYVYVYTPCLNNNASNLGSCSFNKHSLISIIFGKQHQRTFRNDEPIRLSLSLHFYLLYLRLNSSERNDMMLTSLNVCK